jgi:hypothetical protein
MGTTKPQLFAIQNEDTPSPDPGHDDPPSGEHARAPAERPRTDMDVEAIDLVDVKERRTVDSDKTTGFMRDISKPEKPAITDADHRDGKPRWEIANLTEGEWRRALAHNDSEIAEVVPGSPEFARLMEVRHRMSFPPPKGVKYDDISRYHAEQIRKELEATMPRRPRIDRKWILLGVGFVVLAALGAALLFSEIGGDAPAADPTTTPNDVSPKRTAQPTAPHRQQPSPTAVSTTTATTSPSVGPAPSATIMPQGRPPQKAPSSKTTTTPTSPQPPPTPPPAQIPSSWAPTF